MAGSKFHFIVAVLVFIVGLIGATYGAQIEIDNADDLKSQIEWTNVSCSYLEDSSYFWAYGCPAQTERTNASTSGFWSPCNYQTCNFVYSKGWWFNDPKKLVIQGYIAGNATLVVSRIHNRTVTEVIETFTSGQSWRNLEVDTSSMKNSSNIIFTLDRGTLDKENFVVIDKISLDFTYSEPEEPSSSSKTQISFAFTVLMSGLLFISFKHMN